ncbi:hypothetical protein NL108_000568 [Boleophthalmus pectinirostris]|nr:hypothetical protein NL108_000568 [Boleophthalmus pectinirostris]
MTHQDKIETIFVIFDIYLYFTVIVADIYQCLYKSVSILSLVKCQTSRPRQDRVHAPSRPRQARVQMRSSTGRDQDHKKTLLRTTMLTDSFDDQKYLEKQAFIL